MQKTIEGLSTALLSAVYRGTINKGAIVLFHSLQGENLNARTLHDNSELATK